MPRSTLDAELVAHVLQKLRHRQRVSARHEEIIQGAGVIELQQGAPRGGQDRFDRSAGFDDVLRTPDDGARGRDAQRRGQPVALDLSRRSGWDVVHEAKHACHLELRQPGGDMLAQLARGDPRTGLQQDGRADVLAQPNMRNGERRRARHVGMLEQDVIEFSRRNLLPSPVDHFLQPAREKQVSVLVEVPLVAGSEPRTAEHVSPAIASGLRSACASKS